MIETMLPTDIEEIIDSLPQGVIDALSGTTVAITGGRGFLGRYFVEVLLGLNARGKVARPVEVFVVDSLITAGPAGCEDFQAPHYAFVEGDVSSPTFIPLEDAKWSLVQPRYILHCAGIASPHYYRQHPFQTIDAAVGGTRNVLNWAKQAASRVVVFSSSEIYGNPDPAFVPTREDYPGLVPPMGARACYDESKRLGETLVSVFYKMHHTAAMVVRPFNVYGPGMQKQDYRLMPSLACKLLANEPAAIYGTGQQTRTFCYVTDAIRGFLQVLVDGEAGQAYNVGNPTPEVSMFALLDEVKAACPWLPVAFERVAYPDSYPADEPMRRCPDVSKAQRQVGYVPHVSLREGLRRYFTWARAAY